MKRRCRELLASSLRDPLSISVLRHARIVTDPKKLMELYEEAARQKLSIEADRKRRS